MLQILCMTASRVTILSLTSLLMIKFVKHGNLGNSIAVLAIADKSNGMYNMSGYMGTSIEYVNFGAFIYRNS